MSELIVMLTNNDKTVPNPKELFLGCQNLAVEYWGIKTDPLPLNEMKSFVDLLHQNKKTAVFEAVCYSEEEGLEAAQKAAYCKSDILMGTVFSTRINDFCKSKNIKYMPFVGRPSLLPSILQGTAQEILTQIEAYISRGCFGVDYLAYRHTQEAELILKSVLQKTKRKNLCIAGSVDSPEKVRTIKKLGCDFFTIGTAFFEKKFGHNLAEEINTVLSILKEK